MHHAPYGRPHADAPPELARFAFIIGEWKGDVKARAEGGGWNALSADWVGRYVLDGLAIEEEFRMTTLSGDLVMLGRNYRAYDRAANRWVMKWFEALSATWLDLGPEELGGVQFTDTSIRFVIPFQPGVLHRATFSDIAPDRFTWRADESRDNGATWSDSIMVIRARRVQP